MIEDSIAGFVSINVSAAGDYTLSTNNGATDEARMATLRIGGSPSSARNVVIPAVAKQYVIECTVGTSVTVAVKTNSGSAVNLLAGQKVHVYCDGLNVYRSGAGGSSALYDAGVSALNMVQLDSTGKLPAVDGSQLTNLPSAPVQSVNGRTGAVVVSVGDVSAGLGTAAFLNVGTGASQIVQLDGSARLPAVNGSQLTNLTGVPVVTNGASGRIVIGAVTIQWGTGTTNSATSFGVAFSSTPYSIQGMSTLVGNQGPVSIPSGTWSSSGFTSSAGGNNPFTWIAIGPT